MNGHFPKWFLHTIASLLGVYFLWSFGGWIQGVNADVILLKHEIIDVREEQLLNFMWLADQFDDPIKGKELRNKLYDLRLNRK